MFFRLFKPNLIQNYVNDQKGIMNRFLSESTNWEGHIKFTKNFILDYILMQSKLKIAVLGSGWLIDFPMEELVKKHQIYLYDIYHPSTIKHKFRNNSNIFFIEQDLTFGLVDKLQKECNFEQFVDYAKKIQPSIDFSEFDVVISLNILNQLDILLLENSRFCDDQKSELLELRKQIQDNHIKLLPKGKSLLVTDWIELNYQTNKQFLSEKRLIYSELLNDLPFKEWYWEFDTRKTYRKKFNTTFKVRAFSL